ncbi:MAG TPA: hypothetical protein VGR07_07980 [Thermoanaerobaculia bacterium]|jgi:hypothetical protein|nr:hypothetical protein [Thermoanaerobaculia bacterium]
MRLGTYLSRHATLFATFFAISVALALPRLAAACATCYGAADSPMVDGQNKAILVLLGFVGLVYVFVGKLIWDFRQRAKRLPPPESAAPAPRIRHLRLIHGGKH